MAVHCWKDKGDYMATIHGFLSEEHLAAMGDDSATCMLDDGHEGEHEWTPDRNIGVSFAPLVVE